MFGLFRNLAPDLKLAGYKERCEKAIGVLADACGVDRSRELERFRWCHQHLGRDENAPPPKLGDGANMLEQLATVTAQGLPLLFEFVLSHSGGRAPRFAYLTQGQPAGSMTQSLGLLLSAVLKMHIESNGDHGEAELLARQFRLAFPGLATLDGFAPTAQAMLVGLVPAEEHTQLKIYFNTRMDTSTPHRERVLGLLDSCGLTDDGLYGLLYDDTEGTRFHGIGIDLQGGRAKLYVHVHRDNVDEILERLARHLHGNGNAEKKIIEPPQAMLTAIDSKTLLDQVEVAVALRRDGDTTVKLTAFLSPKRSGADDVERVAAYVESMGHDIGPLRQATVTLAEGLENPGRQTQPVRGVGIETPTGERAKVNVYLQATM